MASIDKRMARTINGKPMRHPWKPGGVDNLPGQFRVSATLGTSAGSARGAVRSGIGRGATTPIEMMYFSASSTEMSSSCTLAFGTMMK